MGRGGRCALQGDFHARPDDAVAFSYFPPPYFPLGSPRANSLASPACSPAPSPSPSLTPSRICPIPLLTNRPHHAHHSNTNPAPPSCKAAHYVVRAAAARASRPNRSCTRMRRGRSAVAWPAANPDATSPRVGTSLSVPTPRQCKATAHPSAQSCTRCHCRSLPAGR